MSYDDRFRSLVVFPGAGHLVASPSGDDFFDTIERVRACRSEDLDDQIVVVRVLPSTAG